MAPKVIYDTHLIRLSILIVIIIVICNAIIIFYISRQLEAQGNYINIKSFKPTAIETVTKVCSDLLLCLACLDNLLHNPGTDCL